MDEKTNNLALHGWMLMVKFNTARVMCLSSSTQHSVSQCALMKYLVEMYNMWDDIIKMLCY